MDRNKILLTSAKLLLIANILFWIVLFLIALKDGIPEIQNMILPTILSYMIYLAIALLYAFSLAGILKRSKKIYFFSIGFTLFVFISSLTDETGQIDAISFLLSFLTFINLLLLWPQIGGLKESEKISIDELKSILDQHNIDYSKWGTGSSKTLNHLLEEINSREATLVADEERGIIRKAEVSDVFIYYNSPDGKRYLLREEKQVFSDGRERKRNMEWTVAEKMKKGEDPEEVVKRGVYEELGIKGDLQLKKIEDRNEIIESPSYPGLFTDYTLHMYQVHFTDEQYNKDGYKEEQEDKSSYFQWKEIGV